MLKFYSTGQFPKSLDPPQRFKNRQASKGDADSMYQRNYEDPQNFDFKAATHVSGNQFHHKQYHKINGNYKFINSQLFSSDRFFEPQYNSTQQIEKKERVFFETAAREQNLQNPSHLNNWKIVRERKFAERVQNPNEQCTQGQLLAKSEYIQSNKESVGSNKSNWVMRQNMFEISKPLLRINKDMKNQPLIKNVQTVSDDIPEWGKTTNKYYTPENFDLTKKQRQQRLAKADIFGNLIQEPNKDPNNKVYQDNPFVGQRFESSRMCVFYDKPDRVRDKVGKDDLKRSKVNLNWKENVSSQRFEPKLPKDIGNTDTPYIKKLERKRDPNYPKIEKIGQSEIYKKIEKDKPIQLKIGHGEPQTLNPVKY